MVVTVSFTLDRYGDFYVSPGVNGGSPIIEFGSASLAAGWIQNPIDHPVQSQDQVKSYLKGPVVTGSAEIIGGGGVLRSPWATQGEGDAFTSRNFSYEAGAYTPQIGVSGTFGFLLIEHK